MQDYLTTTSVGDLIRKARGAQELPKATEAIPDGIALDRTAENLVDKAPRIS